MGTMLALTAENFRAEMYRHKLSRKDVCRLIGMHVNALSMYVNGVRPMPGWAEHNIGWSINRLTGLPVFDVDMQLGPLEPPRGRPTPVKLYAPKRRRRRYVKLADAPPSLYQRTGRLPTVAEDDPHLRAKGYERQ